MNNTHKTPYFVAEDLKKFGGVSDSTPEVGEKFFDWYQSVFEDGNLTKKEKSLIALSVALAIKCPYCIDAYTNECIQFGYTEADMSEANHVAAAITGGASLVHGVQMKNIADKKIMK